MSSQNNVVIVGAGPAGLLIYNGLSAKLSKSPGTNVILIEPKPFHLHRPSSLRMLVTSEGELENNKTLMEHPPSLHAGDNRRVVQSKVTAIVDNGDKGRYVTLANGENIDYSVLVLATGSSWQGPLAFGETKDEILESVNSWRARFKAAKDIVLVGGGAVGFELSGEIKDSYPNTRVTIVHTQNLPLNAAYKDRWRRGVLRRAEKRGITVLLGDAIDDSALTDGKIVTRNGRSIPSDLVVPTFGPRPNTEVIKTLGADVLSSSGHVKVQPTLQLLNHPRIFAAGDIIEWKEEKQVMKAMGHSGVVVNNILNLLNGRGSLKHYNTGPEMIVLTNGKNGGTMFIGILWGLIFGDWLSRMLKSKNLLIEMSRKSYGLHE